MNIVSFDSGLRECGVAYFDGATMTDCAMPVSECKKERGIVAWNAMAAAAVPWILDKKPDVFVYEMMQSYESSSAAKNNDILQLVGVLGAVGFDLVKSFPDLKLVGYLPREWKGQVKKDIHHRRITGATSRRTRRWRPGILTNQELEILATSRRGVPEAKQHNIVDGIGIGLYHVGRGPKWRK